MIDGASQQLEPSDSDLLLSAKAEIDQLRRANEIMSAQIAVMELFKATLLAHPPKQDVGWAPDVAQSLERRSTALRVQGRMGGAVEAAPDTAAAVGAWPARAQFTPPGGF